MGFPKHRLYGHVVLGVLFLLVITTAPRIPACAEVKKEAIEHFISLIDVMVAKQNFFPGRKISGYDYDFNKESYRIGGKNGTGIFRYDTTSSLQRNTSTLKYKATVHSEGSGWSAGTRFGDYKKHSIIFGKSKKDIYLDPYYKTVIQGVCQPCEFLVSQADLSSESQFFQYTYNLSDYDKLDMGYERGKMMLDTPGLPSLTTSIFTLGWRRDKGKTSLAASLAGYKSSSIRGNKHVHLAYSRKLRKQVVFFLETGLFTNGLPTIAGPFSDIGDRFVFNYLSRENDNFDTLYSEKFGYYSLGIKATFNVKNKL